MRVKGRFKEELKKSLKALERYCAPIKLLVDIDLSSVYNM